MNYALHRQIALDILLHLLKYNPTEHLRIEKMRRVVTYFTTMEAKYA